MKIKAQNPEALREIIRQRRVEIKRLELMLELSEYERKSRLDVERDRVQPDTDRGQR
jgi:hypothetical protein